jgi:hypothetical protein
MCSLCGVLGGRGHWTEQSSTPEAFASRFEPSTRRRERQERTRLANAVLGHYNLTLADWEGASYVLSGPTGRRAMVENLTELWAAAESLAKKPCDPLDDALLAALARGGRT